MIKPCKRCGSLERYVNKEGKTQKCKKCQRAYSLHKAYKKRQNFSGIEITPEFSDFLLVQAFKRIKEIDIKREKEGVKNESREIFGYTRGGYGVF